MAKLDPYIQEKIAACLCEGVSGRSITRIFEVEQLKVAEILEDLGDMAIRHLESLKDLKIEKIQADELYAFIYAKEYNIDKIVNAPEYAGTTWGYLAMDCVSKFIFSYFLGDRTTEDATFFMQDVADKLKRKEGSREFEVRPTIATDGLNAYEGAVQTAFGADADYGVLVKSYSKVDKKGNRKPGSRYIGSVRKAKSGKPKEADTHTSYIERQNLNIRMFNRRYTRRTNAFSKTALNHTRHLALTIMYHNYCLIPRPVRPLDEHGRTQLNDDGTKKSWVKRSPPAIELGLTKRVWTVKDLLMLSDEYKAERLKKKRTEKEKAKAEEKAARAKARADVSGDRQAPFWVYHSHVHRSTKVHRSECTACNDGHGKQRRGNTKSGEWLPFATYDDAVDCAETLRPEFNTLCVCIHGSHRSLGRKIRSTGDWVTTAFPFR